MKQIEQIKSKLWTLKINSKRNEIFGSIKHKFELNPKLNVQEIINFENLYKIQLPQEYREFILQIGNGEVGPFSGIVQLENSIYVDLNYKREGEYVNPSLPFPFTEAWNFEEFNVDNEEEYFDIKYVNGLIRLCNYGCGIFINLVVNGDDYGNMWTDSRCNDGGIYPSIELGNKEKVTFLEWYELWLDKSLEELKNLE